MHQILLFVTLITMLILYVWNIMIMSHLAAAALVGLIKHTETLLCAEEAII